MNINIILIILIGIIIYNHIYAIDLFVDTDKYIDTDVDTDKYIDTDTDKYINIHDYDIKEIPNFLTHEECNKIIELSKGNMVSSKVYSHDEDLFDTKTRISEQCWLKDDNIIIKDITERIKLHTNTYNNYYEELQVVNYKPGGFFVPHYDACVGDKDTCQRMNQNNGPRYLTVLFYLNDNFDGGETIFPKINKLVKPEKGKAVIFQNVNNNGVIINQALHGGEPVKNGEKWIANKWIRL